MEALCQKTLVEALQHVAALAASTELEQAVGCGGTAAVYHWVSMAQSWLGHADGTVPAPLLYSLARECLGLASRVDRGYDDGTLHQAGAPQAAMTWLDEDPEDCGWDFGLAVAEAIASSLAAFASVIPLARADFQERQLLQNLSIDLDFFGPNLFGGLSRLGALERDRYSEREARLFRTLQQICVWAAAVIGRTVGYANLSAEVLWNWASADPVWAVVLAKGVISAGIGRDSAVPAPHDLFELQAAVARALLGFASPDVAFVGEVEEANEVSIASRNERLARHRADLAAACTGMNLPSVLLGAAARLPASLGEELASFLAGLLQPELAVGDLPLASEAAEVGPVLLEGGSAAGASAAVVWDARNAAAMLAGRLRPQAEAIWAALTAVAGTSVRQRFYQDCANLAYFVPPPLELHTGGRIGLQGFLSACLTGGSPPEPVIVAVLCFLATNADASPVEAGPLVQAITSLSPEAQGVVMARWERWRGPVKGDNLCQWALLFEVTTAASLPVPAPAIPPRTERPPAPPPRARGMALQELAHEAPREFVCALDGQLMLDPVRSPHGHIFERAGLAHALAEVGGTCPISGQPLELEDCVRLPELRRRIAEWVRKRRPQASRAA